MRHSVTSSTDCWKLSFGCIHDRRAAEGGGGRSGMGMLGGASGIARQCAPVPAGATACRPHARPGSRRPGGVTLLNSSLSFEGVVAPFLRPKDRITGCVVRGWRICPSLRLVPPRSWQSTPRPPHLQQVSSFPATADIDSVTGAPSAVSPDRLPTEDGNNPHRFASACGDVNQDHSLRQDPQQN